MWGQVRNQVLETETFMYSHSEPTPFLPASLWNLLTLEGAHSLGADGTASTLGGEVAMSSRKAAAPYPSAETQARPFLVP